MEWGRYSRLVQEYDALLAYAKEQSSALVGLRFSERRLTYAEKIFVKMIGHSITLRRISPDPERKAPQELWDASSAASVARCVIEAHEALTYIALGTTDPEEQEFRIMLWELHDVIRRVKMAEAMGITGRKPQEMLETARERKDALVQHPFYARTGEKFRADVRKGDPPHFHLSRRERGESDGISYDYLNGATMQLSQFVHTLPMSIHQLLAFQAGTPDALRMMSLPLQHSPVFLTRAVVGMQDLFGDRMPKPSSELHRLMLLWAHLAKQGLRVMG